MPLIVLGWAMSMTANAVACAAAAVALAPLAVVEAVVKAGEHEDQDSQLGL